MTERPIILKPREVAAILRWGPTQHYTLWRVVTPPAEAHYKDSPAEFHKEFPSVARAAQDGWIFWTMDVSEEQQPELDEFTRRAYEEGITCPYGVAGDMLWGQETWAAISPDEHERPIAACGIEYRADGEWTRFPGQWPPEFADDPERPHWRSPLTMPRWASRVGLEVVFSYPRRLHDLADTIAWQSGFRAMEGFRLHWDTLHPQFPWSLNPWVWSIVCRVVPLPAVDRPPVPEEH